MVEYTTQIHSICVRMTSKKELQQKAIALRKEGKTYGEILKSIPVAKSTLSLWLRDVGLAKKQHQTLTDKKRAAQLRGGLARRTMRIVESEAIFSESEGDIGLLTDRELFLIGVALYWAEGSKAKEYRPSVGVKFSNSDPYMIQLFLRWLREVFGAKRTDITLTVYLHENHKKRVQEVESYWLEVTGLDHGSLSKTVYKKNIPRTVRKNTKEAYMGLVSITLQKSVIQNRRIQGWIRGMVSVQNTKSGE